MTFYKIKGYAADFKPYLDSKRVYLMSTSEVEVYLSQTPASIYKVVFEDKQCSIVITNEMPILVKMSPGELIRDLRHQDYQNLTNQIETGKIIFQEHFGDNIQSLVDDVNDVAEQVTGALSPEEINELLKQ